MQSCLCIEWMYLIKRASTMILIKLHIMVKKKVKMNLFQIWLFHIHYSRPICLLWCKINFFVCMVTVLLFHYYSCMSLKKKKNIKSLHAKFNDWQHQRKVGIHYRASSKSLNRKKKQPTANYYKRSQLLVGHSSISISGMYGFFFLYTAIEYSTRFVKCGKEIKSRTNIC